MDRKLADYRIRRHLPTVLFIIYACRGKIEDMKFGENCVQREILDGKFLSEK